MRKNILLGVLLLLLATPLIMWMIWLITPNTKLVIAIVDKTVLTTSGQEHISLNWVLNHEKYTKTSKKPYKVAHDYFGFFPKENEKFRLQGLERFSSSKLDQLSNDADMAYFTDTYGIYNNEWFQQGDDKERSGILYGGLSDEDIELLQLMKEKGKLIISEFNTIGSPTAYENRSRFEDMFQLKWTGWTARYFDNLNLKENKEIPNWLVRNYKNTHNGKWPFKKSGIAFVNNRDEVVILENETHLNVDVPYILTNPKFQEAYSLPESIKYPFWFDIVIPNKKTNTVVSSFKIDANSSGLKELEKFGIPSSFPAVTQHVENDYTFYYFSGDFADNQVKMTSSYFSGIGYFKGLFYDERNTMERSSFFWKYYRPLLTNILNNYSESIN
ncbi:hypothetical protein [Gramella sp. MAR_2010_147]|uniref:hypothetical protein n=1 Tax=Gramella sp. MAR_2010_147 TaxID=1250205 RepID=UPI00087B7444|nr:hypothetical protein [Gramella sp. MAR_2010_147]SDR93281.1 hypothetical protein SAMN04488553_1065 [Gramella sp. MAR_2010_147]